MLVVPLESISMARGEMTHLWPETLTRPQMWWGVGVRNLLTWRWAFDCVVAGVMDSRVTLHMSLMTMSRTCMSLARIV